MANFTIENLTVLPLAVIIKKDVEKTIEKLMEKGLLIDLSKQFSDYPIMMRQLKLERQVLITKGVLKRYVELNESLQQLHMDNTNMRSWEILHSLHSSLVNLPANEEVKTLTFKSKYECAQHYNISPAMIYLSIQKNCFCQKYINKIKFFIDE